MENGEENLSPVNEIRDQQVTHGLKVPQTGPEQTGVNTGLRKWKSNVKEGGTLGLNIPTIEDDAVHERIAQLQVRVMQ
jgi:hypothetical protein